MALARPVEATPNKCLIAKVRFCLFLGCRVAQFECETQSVIFFRAACCFISGLCQGSPRVVSVQFVLRTATQSNYTRNPNCFRPSTAESHDPRILRDDWNNKRVKKSPRPCKSSIQLKFRSQSFFFCQKRFFAADLLGRVAFHEKKDCMLEIII